MKIWSHLIRIYRVELKTTFWSETNIWNDIGQRRTPMLFRYNFFTITQIL